MIPALLERNCTSLLNISKEGGPGQAHAHRSCPERGLGESSVHWSEEEIALGDLPSAPAGGASRANVIVSAPGRGADTITSAKVQGARF